MHNTEGGSLHRHVYNPLHEEVRGGKSADNPEPVTLTFAFTRAPQLEKIQRICRVQCMSESCWTFTLTFTPTGMPSGNLHVFGLWDEAGAPYKNPGKHSKNVKTTERPRSSVSLKPRTFLLGGNSANHCTTVLPTNTTSLKVSTGDRQPVGCLFFPPFIRWQNNPFSSAANGNNGNSRFLSAVFETFVSISIDSGMKPWRLSPPSAVTHV